MARLRQAVGQPQENDGTRGRHRIALGRNKGRQAVISRLPGAMTRAAFVVCLIAMPSLILRGTGNDGGQVVALVAIFAALFTLVEYSASSPSLVEFRDAPPFNRLRFGALFVTVLLLSLILHGQSQPTTATLFFQFVGERIGVSMDFPYSPVRLTQLMMPADTSGTVLSGLRTAAGLSYLISIVSIAIFILWLRLHGWPSHNGVAFNVWTNLPTFDPTSGGDVVARLNRDSQINFILGFLLPFMIPALVKVAGNFTTPINLDDPQTMIWAVSAWAFLPASLLMRGVALSRVAHMIHAQRKRAYAAAAADGMLSA